MKTLPQSNEQRAYILGRPDVAGTSTTKHTTSQYETKASGSLPVINPSMQEHTPGYPTSWQVVVERNPDRDRQVEFVPQIGAAPMTAQIPQGIGPFSVYFSYIFPQCVSNCATLHAQKAYFSDYYSETYPEPYSYQRLETSSYVYCANSCNYGTAAVAAQPVMLE